jgi:hypothetical protein
MELLLRLRKLENLHIVFWLIKDTCWLLEFRLFGAAMILPAVGLAIYLSVQTFRESEFLMNLAILCWICANSLWMIAELFLNDQGRLFALVPFILGLIAVALYYLKVSRSASGNGSGAAPGGMEL